MSASSDERLARFFRRQTNRTLDAAYRLEAVPRSVERLSGREGGVARASWEGEIDLTPTQGSVRRASAPNMQSELVRKAIEMEMLNAERGLAREAEQAEAEAPAGAAEADIPKDALEQWYREMKEAGLGEAEIVEQLTARLRALRTAHLRGLEERRMARRTS